MRSAGRCTGHCATCSKSAYCLSNFARTPGWDETLGGPEESGWTTSRHIYIRICVQSTHVYVYARRRYEILD